MSAVFWRVHVFMCGQRAGSRTLTHESSMRIMNLKSRSRRLLGSTCQDQGSAGGEGGGVSRASSSWQCQLTVGRASLTTEDAACSQRTLLRSPSKRGSRLRMQPERFCVYVFSVAEDGMEASVSERVGVCGRI